MDLAGGSSITQAANTGPANGPELIHAANPVAFVRQHS